MTKKEHHIFVSEKMQKVHPNDTLHGSYHSEYTNDTDKWISVYHLRSIIESVFSSIKRRWGSFFNSRKRWMQKKELALKVLSYNVKQVLMINYAKERKVPLWIQAK